MFSKRRANRWHHGQGDLFPSLAIMLQQNQNQGPDNACSEKMFVSKPIPRTLVQMLLVRLVVLGDNFLSRMFDLQFMQLSHLPEKRCYVWTFLL